MQLGNRLHSGVMCLAFTTKPPTKGYKMKKDSIRISAIAMMLNGAAIAATKQDIADAMKKKLGL